MSAHQEIADLEKRLYELKQEAVQDQWRAWIQNWAKLFVWEVTIWLPEAPAGVTARACPGNADLPEGRFDLSSEGHIFYDGREVKLTSPSPQALLNYLSCWGVPKEHVHVYPGLQEVLLRNQATVRRILDLMQVMETFEQTGRIISPSELAEE